MPSGVYKRTKEHKKILSKAQTTHGHSLNGVRIAFDELAEMFGLYPQALRRRLFVLNWDIERALITPIKKHKK